SGSASANIFSGDPGKKFDVVFSIDMKQLLTTLGAKPEDIKRIMDIAERNSKKAPAQQTPPVMAQNGPPQAPNGGGGQPVRMMAPAPPPAGAKTGNTKGPVTMAVSNAPAGMPSPGPGAGGQAAMDFARIASSALPPEFGTEEERARAKLPPPPEEDSQLEVLL